MILNVVLNNILLIRIYTLHKSKAKDIVLTEIIKYSKQKLDS